MFSFFNESVDCLEIKELIRDQVHFGYKKSYGCYAFAVV